MQEKELNSRLISGKGKKCIALYMIFLNTVDQNIAV